MRITEMLRRQAKERGVPLQQVDFLLKVAAYIDALERHVHRTRLDHDVICGDDATCNCGATSFNRIIDNLLQIGEMDGTKRTYR